MLTAQGTATPPPSIPESSLSDYNNGSRSAESGKRGSTEKRSEDRDSSQRADPPGHPSASVSIEVNIGNEYNNDAGKRDGKHSPPSDRPHDMQYAPINYSPASGQTCRYDVSSRLPFHWMS